MHEKITLSNGVRIIYEHIPHVRSATIGIWVGTGSRHEKPSQNGISHFIEHMVFKGTQTRSAVEIAGLMDGIGGQVNAFTAKEYTCYYVRALDNHMEIALDVLCDMFFNSKFAESDVETERGVILEEIDMFKDAPEDLVTERLFEAVFKGSPLERPILGKASTLKKLSGASLKNYIETCYPPGRTVVAISGSFSEQDVDFLCRRFSNMNGNAKSSSAAAGYLPAFTAKRKAIEQNHINLAFPGLTYNHPDRYALQLLSNILGSGMSSRLFQKVREEQGLCYSIYSFGTSHEDTGIFGVHTALDREAERQAINFICSEIKKFTDGGATEYELTRAREQVKANVLMNLESSAARMNNLGRSELLAGRMLNAEEIIESYNSVTPDKLSALAGEILDFEKASFSALGRVESADYYRELIRWTCRIKE